MISGMMSDHAKGRDTNDRWGITEQRHLGLTVSDGQGGPTTQELCLAKKKLAFWQGMPLAARTRVRVINVHILVTVLA